MPRTKCFVFINISTQWYYETCFVCVVKYNNIMFIIIFCYLFEYDVSILLVEMCIGTMNYGTMNYAYIYCLGLLKRIHIFFEKVISFSYANVLC